MATQANPATKKKNLDKKIVDELLQMYANTYSLYLKTQNFYWNVTGLNFFSLHKLFEDQHRELAEVISYIAERIRILKVEVPASFSQILALSTIKEVKTTPTPKEMLKQLMHDHETIAHQAHLLRDTAQTAKDDTTLDLLIEQIRAHEKAGWMLRSSLELG